MSICALFLCLYVGGAKFGCIFLMFLLHWCSRWSPSPWLGSSRSLAALGWNWGGQGGCSLTVQKRTSISLFILLCVASLGNMCICWFHLLPFAPGVFVEPFRIGRLWCMPVSKPFCSTGWIWVWCVFNRHVCSCACVCYCFSLFYSSLHVSARSA